MPKVDKERMISVFAIILGLIIFVKPEIVAWIIALYLVVWGLSKLF